MDSTNLITLASQQFEDHTDLYVIVDFLNRALKEKSLVVGLSKADEDNLQITIYEEREN